MFNLTLGTLVLDDYVTSFDVSITPVNDSGEFENWDGTVITSNLGDSIALSIALKKVPTETAQAISNALAASEVDVSYTSPAATSGSFKKVSYKASSRSKGLEWDIAIQLESAAPVNGGYL